MKKLIKVIFIIILFGAAGYFAYNCVYYINDSTIGIVEDTRDDVVLQMAEPGVNIIWKSIIPGRIKVHRVPIKDSSFADILVDIPPLGNLESSYYQIKVPIGFRYRLIPENISFDPAELKKGKKYINHTIKRLAAAEIDKEFSRYLAPVYNRGVLVQRYDELVETAIERIMKKSSSLGIELAEMGLSGNISFPERSIYYEGVRYYNDLRQLEKDNMKEMIRLQNNLKRQSLSRDKYVEKLKEISSLVKGNPELLKYIYIDKLGDNVKVILSSERGGVPFGLSLDEMEDDGKITGDIDNLR